MDDPNDFSSPPAPAVSGAAPREGWAVGAGLGASWWSYGWQVFQRAPGIWIAIALFTFVIIFVLNWIPFVGSVASTLIYPLLFGGILLGTRELDRGGSLRFDHLFSCFSAQALPLVILALIILAGWFVVWLVAFGLLIAIAGFGTIGSLLSDDASSISLGMLLSLGAGAMVALLIGLLLAIPLLMASWFAPALVLFRGDNPVAALRASFSACLRNIPPFTIYGLIGVALAIGATIPLGLGWIVLMPVSAASVYGGYKDIFGTP